MRAGGVATMISYYIADLSGIFLIMGIVSIFGILCTPSNKDGLGIIFGAICCVSIVMMMVAGAARNTSGYWAYRYDKVLSARHALVEECGALMSYACAERMDAYRRDSIEVYWRYSRKSGRCASSDKK